MPFKIGEPVRWVSSNTRKEGVISAVVPAGRMPQDVGYARLGQNSLPRGHESYIVVGGVPGKSRTAYWPVTSLLHPGEGLTAAEVAWCHKNANRVREAFLDEMVACSSANSELVI